MQWHTWSAGVQSDDGWGHFLENKRVMSLRYYDYSARSAESCAVRRCSSFFFFTGHASVKKDARRIRRHTCRQGVKQSQDETRHPLPSREKHKPHGRSFAVWQRLRRQPIYRWEQLFPPLGLILRCNYFSLFTRWPKSACCARATAEELKLRVPWRAHGNSVYLLDFWSYQMIRAVMWTASSDIRLWEIQ